MGFCYLIHLDDPLANGSQHYIGYARDRQHLEERIQKHLAGIGARYLKVAHRQKVSYRVVRIWRSATSADEKRLKQLGGKNLCPHCSPYMRGYTSKVKVAHPE